jgi:two-component system sensor histidine kinase/response regulator
MIPSTDNCEWVVLVVDDIAQNIQVVGSILTEAGYEVMPARSGAEALGRVRIQKPDLILLDLMMPDMDGLEVARRLKSDPATDDVPIIFLTASNELDHLVRAFATGAVDYVTKPFNAAELLSRVRTHMELKTARDALKLQAQRLHELNEEKNGLLSIAAHDLRNPLTNVLGLVDLIREEIGDGQTETRENLDLIRATATHMLRLVKDLLDVNAIELGGRELHPETLALGEIVASVVDQSRRRAAAKGQEIQLEVPESACAVSMDPEAALQIVDNLVSNAVKYSPPGKTIWLRVKSSGQKVSLEVEDEGPGLTQQDLARVFAKFARLSSKPTGGESSTGLGLSIVKSLVEASGGRVWVESPPAKGAKFIVELPMAS